MTDTQPLLILDGVSIVADSAAGASKPLVDGVSLEIAAGERVGLVGESGSGKSLTALAAVDLLPPGTRRSSGTVTVDGTRIPGAGEATFRGRTVGLVMQEPATALNPVYTVGYQLSETISTLRRRTRKEARQDSRTLLGEVGLSENQSSILGAYPHQLSGGQLQRVMLALALAGEPELLIADEPTTALDLETQARILRLLRSISEHRTVGLLLISHDLAVVAGLVQRVLVMLDGKIIEEGPTAELFEDPLHPYTRHLLRSAAREAPVRTVEAAETRAASDLGCSFASRCDLSTEGCSSSTPKLECVSNSRAVRCPVVLQERGRS